LSKVNMMFFVLNTEPVFLQICVHYEGKKENVLATVIILVRELILKPSDMIQRVFLTGLHHKEFLIHLSF